MILWKEVPTTTPGTPVATGNTPRLKPGFKLIVPAPVLGLTTLVSSLHLASTETDRDTATSGPAKATRADG